MQLLISLFAAFLVMQDPALPPLNQRIVDHVATVQGKKVDRGECWDLAAQALNKAGAKWDGFTRSGA